MAFPFVPSPHMAGHGVCAFAGLRVLGLLGLLGPLGPVSNHKSSMMPRMRGSSEGLG